MVWQQWQMGGAGVRGRKQMGGDRVRVSRGSVSNM